jgi:hypothetical protein
MSGEAEHPTRVLVVQFLVPVYDRKGKVIPARARSTR